MVFEQAKERVEGMGGMRAWREREREGMKGGFGGGGGSSWGWDDGHRGGEDGEERMEDERADSSPEPGTRNGVQGEEVEDEVGSLFPPDCTFLSLRNCLLSEVSFLRSVASSFETSPWTFISLLTSQTLPTAGIHFSDDVQIHEYRSLDYRL